MGGPVQLHQVEKETVSDVYMWDCVFCAEKFSSWLAFDEHLRTAKHVEDAPDVVNAPPHYTRLKPEPIDVIESWGLDFHTAQVLKYISRAGHKDPSKETEDLMKAKFYLERRIARLQKGESTK